MDIWPYPLLPIGVLWVLHHYNMWTENVCQHPKVSTQVSPVQGFFPCVLENETLDSQFWYVAYHACDIFMLRALVNKTDIAS